MYKLIFPLVIFLNINSEAKMNITSDKEVQQYVAKYFEFTMKEKDVRKIENKIHVFYEDIKNLKESTYLTLQNTENNSENLKNYQRVVEIFVAFEALDEFIKNTPSKRDCAKSQEDYKMSLPEDTSKYTPTQTLVVKLFKKICI